MNANCETLSLPAAAESTRRTRSLSANPPPRCLGGCAGRNAISEPAFSLRSLRSLRFESCRHPTPRWLAPLAAVCLGLFAVSGLRAAEPAGPDAQLRDNLRKTTLALRDAQSSLAAAQATQTKLTDDNKALTDQIAKLKENAKKDLEARNRKIDDLDTRVAEQAKEIAQYKEALEKWRTARDQAVEAGQKLESERAKLALENTELQRLIADREAKNLALFRTGNEILTRYEKFSLGEALSAKEPFVGATRARLENLVQDYQDKLAAQRVRK